MPRFAFLEGRMDDFIDDQENKNTRAETNRYNLAENFSSNEGRVQEF